MERIVVGVDGSEASHEALQWATDEARVHGATLTVVHAWTPLLPATFPNDTAAVDPAVYESAAQATLDRALASVERKGVVWQPRLVCGGAAESLLSAAKGADLLVVGSRGRGGFTGLLLGSVGVQVSHHAPCPVVVIPVRSR